MTKMAVSSYTRHTTNNPLSSSLNAIPRVSQ